MKNIYFIFIINIIFLANATIDDETSNENNYSELLGYVREDLIDKILEYLPKLQVTNILKISTQISREKEDYSLNDVETAYLIYKWITQNIEYDCSDTQLPHESANVVFNRGKGKSYGISDLFKTICNFASIKTDSIGGFIKRTKYNYTINIDEGEGFWNYININNTYYLLDVSMGCGYCIHSNFFPHYSKFYFGTNPEIFIRSHFPEEKKWQLLEKEISSEKFFSMVYLFDNFYFLGFNKIDPDSDTLSYHDYTDITLNYNEELKPNLTYYGTFYNRQLTNITLVEIGNYSYTERSTTLRIYQLENQMDYFILLAGNEQINIEIIAFYKINTYSHQNFLDFKDKKPLFNFIRKGNQQMSLKKPLKERNIIDLINKKM